VLKLSLRFRKAAFVVRASPNPVRLEHSGTILISPYRIPIRSHGVKQFAENSSQADSFADRQIVANPELM
jgi:hypothetical protein